MDIATLERDLETKRDQGLALLNQMKVAADREQREFTSPERSAIKQIMDEGNAIKARIAKAKGDESMIADLNRLTAGATPSRNGSKIVSLGDQFVASSSYQFVRQGGHKSSSWRTPSSELDVSAVFHPSLPMAATLTGDPASGGAMNVPQYLPGIVPTPMGIPTIGELFNVQPTDSKLLTFMRETLFTNAAAVVPEGTVKPESALTFEAVQETAKKIAHFLPVSSEMLEDVAGLRGYIDQRLRLGVLLELDDELLNGTGGTDHFEGFLTRSDLAPTIPAGTDSAPDAIAAQIAAIEAAQQMRVDGIVLNPVDWQQMILLKTSGGEYIGRSPFDPPLAPSLWGRAVALSSKMPQGTSLVGAFKTAGQLFTRGGLRVEASNSHSDYFIKNLVAILAEMRVIEALYRPQAFGLVTGLNPVTP